MMKKLLMMGLGLWGARVACATSEATRALSQSILLAERNLEYMSMSFSMPDMGEGKGKGKGKGSKKGGMGMSKGMSKGMGKKGIDMDKENGSTNPPKGKGKKSGSKAEDKDPKSKDPNCKDPNCKDPSCKDPKDPKSKGSKSKEGKGKGKGKGSNASPTVPESPTTSPAPMAPTAPTAPTQSSGTTIPTSGLPMLTELTPYVLFYTIDQFRLPLANEYAAVANVTSVYLNEYFGLYFRGTSLVDFVRADTIMTGNSFNFNQPVEIDYTTTLRFDPSSVSVPSISELDSALETAFNGTSLDVYIALIQNLGSDNIFSTTSDISFVSNDPAPTSRKGVNNTVAGIAIGAGAGVFLLLAAAIVYKRKRNGTEEVNKYNNNHAGDGHLTVTGETATINSSCESRTYPLQQIATSQSRSVRPPSPAISSSAGLYNDDSDGEDSALTSPRLQDVHLA